MAFIADVGGVGHLAVVRAEVVVAEAAVLETEHACSGRTDRSECGD